MKTKLIKALLAVATLIVGVLALSLPARTGNGVNESNPVDKSKATHARPKTKSPSGKLAKSKTKARRHAKKQNAMPRLAMQANYMKYDDINDLDQDAQVILICTPLKDFLDREHIVTRYSDGHLQDFYTLTDVRIQKIIKKPADVKLEVGQTLQIIEPVSVLDQGKSGKVKVATENYQELRKASKYILFLMKGGIDKYGVINMNLGKFNLDGTDLDDLGNEDKPLEREKKLKFKKEVIKKYGDKLK